MDRFEQLKKSGGTAFPTNGYSDGLTALDWFAGQALAGLLARRDFHLFDDAGDDMRATLAARNAYAIARAMLAERTREQ